MFVEVGITLIALAGMVMYCWQDMETFYRKSKLKRAAAYTATTEKNINDIYYSSEGMVHILRRLIKVTIGVDSKYAIYGFCAITCIVPVIIASMTYNVISDLARISLTAISGIIPIILLLAKLQDIRVRSSKEGKILIIELLDNYKIHYYNMQHAIEITASTIEEAPSCKRLLFNLSKGLNRVSNNEEIRSLLDDFRYAIGTSWSGILTDNIYFALSSGVRVDVALGDLISAVSMAEEVEEKSKRENNEAGLILKYMVPICYGMTFLGAIKFFGLTAKEFFYYQFATKVGLSWFVAIVVMYVTSLIAKFFLTRNKLDL